MNGLETTNRFLRPIDVRATPRNRRRVQARRLLIFLTNLVLVTVLLAGAGWVYQRTQQDSRFAIRTIETVGLDHASKAAVERVTRSYQGANLFRLDIKRLQAELSGISWVEGAAIEKKLPDALRIQIFERVPVAIWRGPKGERYIDRHGAIFAVLSPRIDNARLPVITHSTPDQARRCVSFLQSLDAGEDGLLARIETIRPADGSGWIVQDRRLETAVIVNEQNARGKWTLLDRIAAVEGLDHAGIEYADLRFEGQIVLKAIHQERLGGEVDHAQDR